MRPATAFFDTLQDIADVIFEVIGNTPEAASERAMLMAFELRGYTAETF